MSERVGKAENRRWRGFGGLSGSDAANERHLGATGQLSRVCESNMNGGLTGIARIVIGSNDQAFSQKALGRRNRIQPFKERSIKLPPIENNRGWF